MTTKIDLLMATLTAGALPTVAPPPTRSRGGNVVERIMLELRVDEKRCLSCGGCVSVCPRMHVPVSSFHSIAEGVLCRGCGLCVQACPVEALTQAPVPAPVTPRLPIERRAQPRVIPAYQETT